MKLARAENGSYGGKSIGLRIDEIETSGTRFEQHEQCDDKKTTTLVCVRMVGVHHHVHGKIQLRSCFIWLGSCFHVVCVHACASGCVSLAAACKLSL